MINPKDFYLEIIKHSEFITGVPDSLLKEFNACILNEHPVDKHIIAPNEGSSIGLAIGNYISTGKVPTVYMQNSGIGNAINPLLSLADKDVYGVPMVIFIGWRGEPGTKDEPQHFKQGLIQEELLRAIRLDHIVIDSTLRDIEQTINQVYNSALDDKCPKVVLIRKGTFSDYPLKFNTEKINLESREYALKTIIETFDKECLFIGTTGKTSRELFELRVSRGESHETDFLTVGGMGHASAIATGVSMNTTKRVVCIDGDGALLMHMGGLVSSAYYANDNFVHIVINNGVHESVGGQPTLINNVDIQKLALACGYSKAYSIKDANSFKTLCESGAMEFGPTLIEYKVKPGSRKDLGRPSHGPKENLKNLMRVVGE